MFKAGLFLWIGNCIGEDFVIRPEVKTSSPLDVEGIDLDITSDEIVQFIHEGRRMHQAG